MILHFECDYTRGALPEVMQALNVSMPEHNDGYGLDQHCANAARLIREQAGLPDSADVFFLTGGTQTNAVIIDAVCPPWKGVITAPTGHIAVHEAGAIEATGRKVIEIEATDGKISRDSLSRWFDAFYADPTWPHRVEPGMVYISQPTELGSIYTREELAELYAECGRRGVKLFIDGARLAYALANQEHPLTLHDIASSCDVFYFGGTKAGLLFGEAVIVPAGGLMPQLFTIAKRRGALLAKGWLLGLQFEALFSNSLWQRAASRAVALAMMLRRGLMQAGLKPWADSPTNQQFFILRNELIDIISPNVAFSLLDSRGETETVVRFVTDWSTTSDDVSSLLNLINGLS